jgi:hypothetical protein
MTTTTPPTRNSKQATAVRPSTPCPQLPPERVRELVRLERQMIPVLNSIRAELGKRPVIVPKE